MKKIYFVITALLLLGAVSLYAFQDVIEDDGFCDGINWQDHCNPELLPEFTCPVDNNGGTCVFKSMSPKD